MVFGLSDSHPNVNAAKSDLPIKSASSNRMERNLKTSDFKSDQEESENLINGPGEVLVNLLTSLRHLPSAMYSVLIVMALTWLSWFPFFLFDTEWMGKEVYHGVPGGDDVDASKIQAYDQGVREDLAIGVLNLAIVIPQVVLFF